MIGSSYFLSGHSFKKKSDGEGEKKQPGLVKSQMYVSLEEVFQ